MVLHVKWVGIGFGQTLCDSPPERTYWMIGDTSKIPELIEADVIFSAAAAQPIATPEEVGASLVGCAGGI